MGEQTNRRGVEHEPLVSETLEQGAARQRADAERSAETTRAVRETRAAMRGEEPRPRESTPDDERAARREPHVEEPHKAHGDALKDGSGSRHGGHRRDEGEGERRG